MATKRGKSKKKNPCWKGYTAMGDDGQIVMKKKGEKMVPACRPIKGKKDGASMKDKDNGYTYIISESPKAEKQRLKEERKKRVRVTKDKFTDTSSDAYFQDYKRKKKDVKTKRADRMVKRGWEKAREL